MKATDVIESYVHDVAVQLPWGRRADNAAELRSLLLAELGGGDVAAAVALVRRFGRPSEVAARYHSPAIVVDPADTRSFVVAAVFGALFIPSTDRNLPISTDQNTASLLFLAWLGALVLCFAAKGWVMRRWPERFLWKPSPLRSRDRARTLEEFALAAVFVLLTIAYLLPGAALGAAVGVAPGRFAYTADFMGPLRHWWFAACLGVLVVLHVFAGATRRWTPARRIFAIFFLVSAGVQLGWHAAYGGIFQDPAVDDAGRLVFQLAGAFMLLGAAVASFREWNRIPPPASPAQRGGGADRGEGWRSDYAA